VGGSGLNPGSRDSRRHPCRGASAQPRWVGPRNGLRRGAGVVS
jgi:hypothetical protein